jgi:hypothetical protein
VPGISGYRGDNLTAVTAVDPQTVLLEGTPVIDVNANKTDPDTWFTGGPVEFEIANPTIAIGGSGTADAPYINISIVTTGKTGVQISYNLRDLDGTTDDAVQQVALQYRIGNTGDYTNVPGGYVADATSGPSLATLVTPVSVTLPSAVDNQPLVQIRIITTNAAGNDEWVGIDDISISTGAAPTPVLNVSTTALDSFGNAWPVPPGTPVVKSFTVDGTNLTGDITVAAPPAGFETKLSTGGTYGTAPINVTPSGGTVNSTGIDVRFNPAAAGAYSGSLTVSTPGTPNKGVSMFGSASDPAALIMYDEIPYAAGDLTVNTANWLEFQAKTTTGVQAQVTAGSLAFPGLARAASLDNKITLQGVSSAGQGVVRPFTGIADGNLYYSLLLNVATAPTATNPIVAAFREGSGTFVRGGLLAVPGSSAGTYKLGLCFFNATANPGITAGEYTVGQPYLVVVKYSINGANPDEAKLYVFSSGGPFPVVEPGSADVTYTKQGSETDLNDFLTGVVLRQQQFGNPWTADVDAVRAGQQWSVVVPAASSVEDWQLF